MKKYIIFNKNIQIKVNNRENEFSWKINIFLNEWMFLNVCECVCVEEQYLLLQEKMGGKERNNTMILLSCFFLVNI